MAIRIIESSRTFLRNHLFLLAMFILSKLSFIGLRLILRLGRQDYQVSLNQYALELAETGALGRALNLAGYFAKPSGTPKKAIQTTNKALAEFVADQRPNDPEPIVWDVSHIADQFGAEVIDEVPLCGNGCGPMILKQGTKEGKEYRGWVCPIAKSGHPARWMKIGADGHWVFQK